VRVAFDLPEGAERNLREAASYQIDRHTPFRPEDVAFGVVAIGRNADARTVRVELVAVPRTRIEAVSAIAAGVGVAIPRIEVPGAGVAGADLRPLEDNSEQVAPGKRRRADWLSMLLLLIAVFLSAAVIAIPLRSASLEVTQLAAKFAVVKRQVEEAAGLRKEIETAREQSHFLIDRKRTAPNLSRLLQEITKLIPDGTWLTEFQLNGNELQLSGVTASASSLVSLLERSGIVTSTSFRAPVVQEAKGERFQISARLVESGSP
jgi:general secretion pathway protein L